MFFAGLFCASSKKFEIFQSLTLTLAQEFAVRISHFSKPNPLLAPELGLALWPECGLCPTYELALVDNPENGREDGGLVEDNAE